MRVVSIEQQPVYSAVIVFKRQIPVPRSIRLHREGFEYLNTEMFPDLPAELWTYRAMQLYDIQLRQSQNRRKLFYGRIHEHADAFRDFTAFPRLQYGSQFGRLIPADLTLASGKYKSDIINR